MLHDTPTLPRSDIPTLRRSDIPTLRHSDAPTLRHSNAPTLAISLGDLPPLRPSGARGPGPRVWRSGQCKCSPQLGPFCALRVWQKFSHFQFETGFPRVALNNLGTKSGATRFALEKPCLPCKPLFGRPKCIININEFSIL